MKMVLLPEIGRKQERGKEVAFRADAAFAKPEIYEALEAQAKPELVDPSSPPSGHSR